MNACTYTTIRSHPARHAAAFHVSGFTGLTRGGTRMRTILALISLLAS